MSRALLRLAALLLAATAVVMASAQEEPTVGISVEPPDGTVGDVFTAEVRIEAPAGVALVLPGEDADLGDAEVRGLAVEDEALDDGSRRVALRYEFTLWEVGERTVTAPAIAWRTGDGEVRQAERPEATVTIRSVLPEDAEDIQDIRGPREIPLRWYHYLLAVLPLLLFVALIVGTVARLRRRRAGEEGEPEPPPLPPCDEAMRALDELAADDLPAQGQIEEHYVRLSWIVRHYLERRWRLPALEETTGMLAGTMRGSGLVAEETAAAIVALLRRADLAKFAKHRPDAEVAREDVDEARRIVDLTRPAEPAEPEPEA